MSDITALVTQHGIIRRGSIVKVDVAALQAALDDDGFHVIDDGVFGDATEAAVKNFQAAHNIVVDGQVGLQTAVALDAKVASPAKLIMPPPVGAPRWLQAAWREIGVREIPPNRGPAIRRYISLAHVGAEGMPWCAIFANAMLESVGLPGTRSASSQSFRSDSNFVRLGGPVLGAVAVFWRTSRESGLGHVGFYCGERVGHVWTLGGNEGDAVEVEMLAKLSGSFGLLGYWWPKTEPLPNVAPVYVNANVPSKLTSVV